MSDYNSLGTIFLTAIFLCLGFYLFDKSKHSQRYKRFLKLGSIISFIIAGLYIMDFISQNK